MTDEERFCNKRCCSNPCRHRCEYVSNYLDGLAEGRKEGYEQGKNNERELQCGKKNYEKDIARLEKENAELKEQINYQTHCIKTQHEAANKMSKQIAELESKVKQLRCCGNCSEPCWDFPIVRKSECLSNDYSLWEQIK